MARRIPQAVACLFLLAFGVGVWIVIARPFETPRDRALRLCGECGLDGLIDATRDRPGHAPKVMSCGPEPLTARPTLTRTAAR